MKSLFVSLALFASVMAANSQVLACNEPSCDRWDHDQFTGSWYSSGWDYDDRSYFDYDWYFDEKEPCEEEVVVNKCDAECGCDSRVNVIAPTYTRHGDFYAYRQGSCSSCHIDFHRWTSTEDMRDYIPEGATIRIEGGVDVYIVKYINGKMFKRLVLNPQVFENYEHLRWEDVMNVSQDTLDAYTTSDLVRSEKTGNVYRLYPSGDCGTKRLVKVGSCFWKQMDPDSIYLINGFDEKSYTTGSVLEK